MFLIFFEVPQEAFLVRNEISLSLGVNCDELSEIRWR